jgi:transposase InsO family protein
MVDLCREYGISRKTGHKLQNRVAALGKEGLLDQSRAPKTIPHRTPVELVELIVKTRRDHPTWGPKKIKDVLERELERRLPTSSTIGSILVKQGLVERRKQRPRLPPRPTRLAEANAPNDVWCVDYKGQFRLGDGSYCYPLTLTDQYSRFIFACDGMAAIDDEQARESCETVFRTHGLPIAMRSDNGAPFASTGLGSLTRLSVYWLRLGIRLERIRPGHPEENGRHERMHRTLKKETTRPARSNLLQQQERFDAFIQEFNNERPHEALEMKRPVEVYEPSTRKYPDKLEEPTYPVHDDVLRVRSNGGINIGSRVIHVSTALHGELVGIREEDDNRWLISFMDIDLGHIVGDRVQPFPPAGE